MSGFRIACAVFLSAALLPPTRAELRVEPLAPRLPGWHLVWSDDFNGPALDAGRWRVEDAALVKNNELQYYAPDDVYLENGWLVLRSQRRAMGGREFTSGLVETKGKFAQAYGRFEFRARLPRTQGLWPAIWMLPDDGSWPPEIDIMESVGSQPTVVCLSLHTGTWPEVETQTRDHLGPDYSEAFHVFALEWEPGELRWYVDGELRFSTADSVPDKPFYLILNTAVGGTMPGDPDDTTVFPQYFQVDYVRVYAREQPGTFFLTTGAENGRVATTPRQDRFREKATATLTAYPAIGYRFVRWTGEIEDTNNPVAVLMTRHYDTRALFEPDPHAPSLLSAGCAVTASSVESEAFAPANACDGSRTSRWSSAFTDTEWILLDLGAERRVEAVALDWENAFAREYRLDISRDGKTWRNLHAKRDGKGGREEIIGISAAGRYVRLTGAKRAGDWGYSLWEFSVYGRPLDPEPVPSADSTAPQAEDQDP